MMCADNWTVLLWNYRPSIHPFVIVRCHFPVSYWICLTPTPFYNGHYFWRSQTNMHAWSLPQPRKWVCLCWLASPYSPVPTVLLLLHIIMSNRNWYSRPSLTYRTTHNTRYWGTLHSSLAAACILRINNAIPHSLRLLKLAIYKSFHTSFTCRSQYSSCYQFLIEVGLVAPLEIEINTHPSLIDN